MKRYDTQDDANAAVNKLVAAVIIIFVASIIFVNCFFTIRPGERGVLTTWGKVVPLSYGEGWHWKVPIMQAAKRIDVKTQKLEKVADSASLDLQDVQTTVALNYHIKADSAHKLWQEIGSDYRSRVIEPAIQESVKAVTAKFTAKELITKRSNVRQGIHTEIKGKLIQFHIEVDDLSIVNFQFSEEFDKAIEAKVTAEQLKLQSEMDLERIKVEAEQIKATARAEAEAIRIRAEALMQNPKLVDLTIAEAWNGELPQVMMTGGNSATPLFDISSIMQ